MLTFIVLLILAALVALPFVALFGLWRLTTFGWRTAGAGRPAVRSLIFLAAVLTFASPFLAYSAAEHDWLMSRVPAPLKVARIEYRLEKCWCIGMPGDNETGFLVYRLTRDSEEWARRQGPALDVALDDSNAWRSTPVRPWRSDQSDADLTPKRYVLNDHLGRYGFYIDVDPAQESAANRVFNSPGGLYRYTRGGGIAVIDPAGGRVYYAYAG